MGCGSVFNDRRLSPTYRTGRVDRASDFLCTRIDRAIEIQNQALLKSMVLRAQVQFNLQQTVESLSVVVISYICALIIWLSVRCR